MIYSKESYKGFLFLVSLLFFSLFEHKFDEN